MAGKIHNYAVTVEWTGNRGAGTAGYRAYGRDFDIRAGEKPTIRGSSDPAFLGDAGRWNPEDLLLASLSACHKLWYLHLCAEKGIVVTAYRDDAVGTMVEDAGRGGWFKNVVLRPVVTVSPGSDAAQAHRLHEAAHHKCFIANSVNFIVEVDARIVTA